jgi:hypothetical protein
MINEIKLLVTVQVDSDEDLSKKAMGNAAWQAISNAIKYGERIGFEHDLAAYEASIGLVKVEVLKEK